MFLFDQNLSPRLVAALRDVFPDSVHVQEIGLAEAEDAAVWGCAVQRRLAIITKDADFRQRSFLEGSPPKIVWVALGNCSTQLIENLLRARRTEIDAFLSDERASFLNLS